MQAVFAAAMLDPAAYAALHPVAGPVRCIETHVSRVFLTGEFAYKVKKPLRLSFLDYSSPERRATFCHEELRLNRRHAPDLYLDVVPIAGTPAAPRVGATDGPAFEHALRMVQFDTSLELTHLLQAGDVVPQQCSALGERLAAMHASAIPIEVDAPYGTPDAVHRITLDNFLAFRRRLTGVTDAGQLLRLQGYVQQLFDDSRTRIADRRSRGCVREGHGDLHCGNIVRWRDALVAFDGLEFDPALRFIDVASDIGFLTMDLSAHGRDDLRRETLQAWLTANGDFESVALLPYFEVYRALVRAKVAALRGEQAAGGAADATALAHRYLDWATARIDRPAPLVVVMVGLSGSGKTWLAQRIASGLDALVLRSDVERKRIAGLQPLQASASGPDAGLYSLAFNERTYTRLGECVGHAIQGREHVIVDAANLRREERERFHIIAREAAARFVIVHCTAPLEILRTRVRTRSATGADASEATVALLDRQPSYWEPFDEQESGHVVAVDTTSPDSIDQCLRSLQESWRPTGS
jgi:uncharacterized protein